MASLLGILLKLDHRSIRSVEQQLGFGTSALGKVLNGNIRLQMSHVIMILGVLEMTPAEFFDLAYQQKPKSPHRLVQELRKTQGDVEEDQSETPAFEAKVRRTLLKLLWELLRREGFETIFDDEKPV